MGLCRGALLMRKKDVNSTSNVIKNSFNINSTLLLDGILVGAIAGGTAIAYRICLTYGENTLKTVLSYIQNNPLLIAGWFLALVIMGLLVGRLIKDEPMVSGGGIPQVIGEMKGYFHQKWWKVIIGKFIGGILCILGGLSLGRMGPSVQLGAMVGKGVNKGLNRSKTEEKYIITCGASAGLSAAFNAPLAGVMFSLEQMHKNFSIAALVSLMAASLTADFVAENVFGFTSVLHLQVDTLISLHNYWLLIILGVLLGVIGAFHNKMILSVQKMFAKITILKPQYRIVIPFLVAGILGLILPQVLCGGQTLFYSLTSGNLAFNTLIIFLIVKFLFSIFSFGSGAPGGIFFPLLVIGAYIGGIYGNIAISLFGLDPEMINNFIIIAMAGYFAAIVRAPITGIVLIAEMTGSLAHLLSLGVVSIIAYFVAYKLKSSPIYDSLLDNMLKKIDCYKETSSGEKMLTDVVVHYGAFAVNKKISQIKWPRKCLLVSIRREGKEIIPRGDTVILPCDTIVALINIDSYESITRELHEICESADYKCEELECQKT